jgi:hypothetical protein
MDGDAGERGICEGIVFPQDESVMGTWSEVWEHTPHFLEGLKHTYVIYPN